MCLIYNLSPQGDLCLGNKPKPISTHGIMVPLKRNEIASGRTLCATAAAGNLNGIWKFYLILAMKNSVRSQICLWFSVDSFGGYTLSARYIYVILSTC